jgi:hypothetical protein
MRGMWNVDGGVHPRGGVGEIFFRALLLIRRMRVGVDPIGRLVRRGIKVPIPRGTPSTTLWSFGAAPFCLPTNPSALTKSPQSYCRQSILPNLANLWLWG